VHTRVTGAFLVALLALVVLAVAASVASAKQEKVCVEHNGKVLRVGSQSAADAHVRNHSDQIVDCTTGEPPEEEPPPARALIGQVAERVDANQNGVTDALVFEVDGPCQIDTQAAITLRGPDGNINLTIGTNAIATTTDTELRLTPNPNTGTDFTGFPVGDLTVSSVAGITCPAPTATLSGTLSETTAGDVALKTSDGKALKLSTKSAKTEKALQDLAKRDAKVEVKGLKKGDALEVKGVARKAS
jgi:hypothetical protein